VAQVAGYSSLGANAIQYSFPASSTAPGERRLYLDSSLASFIGPTPAGGWANIPAGPASAFLVSVSKEDANILELSTANGGTALSPTALNFLRTWQKTPNSNGVVVANNTEIVTAGWANRGEFLHVKSVDLRSLFCSVGLYDTAGPAEVALSSGGNGYTAVPSPTNINGTTINYSTNSSGNAVITTVYPAQRRTGLTNRPANDVVTTNSIAGTTNTPGTNTITTPGAPQYALGGGSIVVSDQSASFYVIKGTTLSLISPTSTNRQTIQKDSQFEYFGRSWRQLY
jgi:hypothetical protein